MASKYPRQIEAGLSPANCWQVLSKRAQAQLQQWREAGEMSERVMVRALLSSLISPHYWFHLTPDADAGFEAQYEGLIGDFIDNAHRAKDKAAEKELRRYVGRFWYGGQPRD